MNQLWKSLSMEIVLNILEYDGCIKYRNGKYMNQIQNSDERYEMLRQMIKPIYANNRIFVMFSNRHYLRITYWTYWEAQIPNMITDMIDYITYDFVNRQNGRDRYIRI
jgi:hypothetical protein